MNHQPRFSPILSIVLISPFTHAADPIQNIAPVVNEPQTQFNITPKPQTTPPNPNIIHTTPTPTISNDELKNQPDLLYRSLSSSVVLNNVAALRELLPLYQQLPPEKQAKDNIIIPAAKAALARADGRYAEAIQQYRQVIALNPNISAIRLWLAQTLFENRQYEAANDQFNKLKSANDLSPQYQKMIDAYQNAIQKQQRWHFSGSLNYINDNNINNVDSNATLEMGNGAWRAPKSESAQGLGYSASAQRDWHTQSPIAIRTEISTNGRFHWNNHKYDEHAVKLQTGGIYQNARSEIGILPFYQYRWYGGKSYNQELGIRAQLTYRATPRNRIYVATEHSKNHYPNRAWLKGNSHTLSGSLVFTQNPRRYWVLGSDIAKRSARQDSNAYWRYGVRFGVNQEWQYGLSTSLNMSLARRQYDAADIFNIRRSDKELGASLAIWHRKWNVFGATPRLVTQWQKTKSNNPLYSYHKTNAFVELSKTF